MSQRLQYRHTEHIIPATNQQTEIAHFECFQDPQTQTIPVLLTHLGQQHLCQRKLEWTKDNNHGLYVWIGNF